MSENKSTLGYIKAAFKFEFNEQNASNYENDRYPMTALEKYIYVLQTVFTKGELKEVIERYSSFNYGVHLLNSVFPKVENPDEYNSRDGVVCINEHPVQVMGWKEHDEIIKQGVDMGLDEDFINYGFFAQSEVRGIDLEWSFSCEVPNRNSVEYQSNQTLLD